RALIKESGIDPGAYNLRFLGFPYGPTWDRLGEYIKQSMEQLGFKITMEATDAGGWASRTGNWDFDLTLNYTYQYGDPALGVQRLYAAANMVKGSPFANVQGYNNPEADKLWTAAASEVDPAKRQELYSKIQTILVNDVANGFLVDMEFPTLYRSNVKNLVKTAIGLNETFADVYIQKYKRARLAHPVRRGLPPRRTAATRGPPARGVPTEMLCMKFLSFFVSRLGKALTVVLGVVILNFFMIRLAPGDPAAVLAGQAGAGDPAYLAALRAEFGLDKPLLTQLGLYLKGVLQLDLGYSYRNHVPVLDLILERLPATFLLMFCAFVFSIVFGVLLGVIAAKARYNNKRRWIDSSVMTGALLLYATPLFWLSLMGILLFSVLLGWLPAFGMETVGAGYTGWARVQDISLHLILPTVTLGCFFMA